MDQRLEDILVQLATQYAQPALRMWDKRGDYNQRLPRLARALASYNVLVLAGEFPYSLSHIIVNPASALQNWANLYGQLYLKLAGRLFPSSLSLSAHYADERWPAVIYFIGSSTPVIEVLAGYVAPYVAQRQTDSVVSEAELVGLMDFVLQALEASNLPLGVYRQLSSEGAALIRQMLQSPVRQVALTDFDRLIFTDSQRLIVIDPPSTLPEEAPSDPTVPDMNALTALEKAAALSRSDTETLPPTQPLPTGLAPPVLLNLNDRRGKTPPFKRRGNVRRPLPPVMPLPGSDSNSDKD